MAEVVLRPRRDGDVAAIAALMRRPRVLRGTLRVPFASDEFYRGWIKEDPNIHAIMAEVAGEVVGQGVLHRHVGRRAHVGSPALAVHDEWSGRGVGTALMAAIVDLADNWLGLRRLSLEVYVDNAPAIRLYERFGFEREGVLRGESLREGVLVDSLVMGRLTRAPERQAAGPGG